MTLLAWVVLRWWDACRGAARVCADPTLCCVLKLLPAAVRHTTLLLCWHTGDANTPVLGKQIAAFQGHHQRPWTITQREFANNVHQVSSRLWQQQQLVGAGAFVACCSPVPPVCPLARTAGAAP